MFFDDVKDIPSLSEKCGFSIFVLPRNAEVFPPQKNSIIIEPDKNGKITVETVREIIDFCKVEQKNPFFIIIKEADRLNEQAENAFLKLLEEPANNYHFALIVNDPSTLLETVLSRGNLYILRDKNPLETSVSAPSADHRYYAKLLIAAKPIDLPEIAEKITGDSKMKKDLRNNVLTILSIAIETAYKSYFKTKDLRFVKKLPNLLKAEERIRKNGHIKLHLVADLC